MATDLYIEKKIPYERLVLIEKGKSELEKYVEIKFLCLPETVDPRSKSQNL